MQLPKPYHEERPWGEFVRFTENTPSTVKIITVKPGQISSLQKHANRDEFWYIISGKGNVTVNREQTPTKAGDEFFVPRETEHRIESEQGDEPLVLLEIAIGAYDESDVERLEDRYGRVK